jgi:hypothetical protein
MIMIKKLVGFSFFGFLGAFLIFQHLGAPPIKVTRVANPSYVITSEAGEARTSLFDPTGNSEVTKVGRWILRRDQSRAACGKAESWHTRVRRIFDITSVLAATCTEGSCGGQYSLAQIVSCPPACGSGSTRFIQDLSVPYDSKWKYDGNGTCPANDGSGHCRCQQISCSS